MDGPGRADSSASAGASERVSSGSTINPLREVREHPTIEHSADGHAMVLGAMPHRHWRHLLHDVTARVRAMEPAVPPGDELRQLASELALLDASYEAEAARIAVEARRRLAD